MIATAEPVDRRQGLLNFKADHMAPKLIENESQARYVVTYRSEGDLDRSEVPFETIGTTGGDAVTIGSSAVSIAELREAHTSFFRDWMEG